MAQREYPPRRGRSSPPPGRGGATVGRALAIGSLVVVFGVILAIIVGSGKSNSPSPTSTPAATQSNSGTTTHTTPAATAVAAPVPILTYNVVNTQPPGSTLPPSLYVPTADFTAQMQALKAAGWHAITLNQLAAYWSGHLHVTKPIVLTFDGGYASQYNNALPALRTLGWVGVANVPVTLLPSSEGGLSTTQVQAMKSAGWEINALSPVQPDLTTVDPTTAQQQLTSTRQSLASTYGAAVNWLAYSLGKYNATVAAAAKAAGFAGALTGAPGWANPTGNRFTLARVVVSGGTSAAQLLTQIATDKSAAAPPTASG